jgi:uncharacterized protein (DUF1330 family)
MPAYVFANIRITDASDYERYKEIVPATIERFGGRYLARGGRTEVLEGELEPGRVILLEFPSYEHAERWYSSTEYARAKLVRQDSSEGELVFIDGL